MNNDFKKLKEMVGIDDIAYSIGYRLNRQAGVGKYIEMVLPDGNNGKLDTIVINNYKDKGQQHYFHRNGLGRGDVVDFIVENQNKFQESGRNKWEIAKHVLCRFAGNPIPEKEEEMKAVHKIGTIDHKLNPDRFDVLPISEHKRLAMSILEKRNINEDTLDVFASHIVAIRDKESSYNKYVMGFPYTVADNDEVKGYEIRGWGSFKGKAAGSDSSTAAWFFTKGNPATVDKIYFAESSFDIMAFYQANRNKLNLESAAFVSLGGTFSNGQVMNIQQRFPNAKLVDCFDNDLAGRIYSIRLLGLVNKKAFNIVSKGDTVNVQWGLESVSIPEAKLTAAELTKQLKLDNSIETWTAPKGYKDWNDVIMNKSETYAVKTKFQRDENLRKSRMRL